MQASASKYLHVARNQHSHDSNTYDPHSTFDHPIGQPSVLLDFPFETNLACLLPSMCLIALRPWYRLVKLCEAVCLLPQFCRKLQGSNHSSCSAQAHGKCRLLLRFKEGRHAGGKHIAHQRSQSGLNSDQDVETGSCMQPQCEKVA